MKCCVFVTNCARECLCQLYLPAYLSKIVRASSVMLCYVSNGRRSIPEEYRVLFLQGGGVGLFSAIPLNLIGRKEQRAADYIIAGSWSNSAAREAEKYAKKVHRITPPEGNAHHCNYYYRTITTTTTTTFMWRFYVGAVGVLQHFQISAEHHSVALLHGTKIELRNFIISCLLLVV